MSKANDTLYELSLEYGRAGVYFYVLRKEQREKYRFMFGFDRNKKRSLEKAKGYINKLIYDVQRIVFATEIDSEKKKFVSMMLQEIGYYRKSYNATLFQNFNNVVFGEKQDFLSYRISVIKRLTKLRDAYIEKYRSI